MQKKGQTWSIELIISLTVFVLIIIGVFVSLASKTADPVQDLQKQSQQFINRFYDSGSNAQQTYSFIDGNTLNNDKLAQLQATDYAQIKSQLGLKDDFCIILVDSNNNIIPISNSDGTDAFYGVGSGDIEISDGVRCNNSVN